MASKVPVRADPVRGPGMNIITINYPSRMRTNVLRCSVSQRHARTDLSGGGGGGGGTLFLYEE